MIFNNAYLRHILDSIQQVESYTRCDRENFLQDQKSQDATILRLEIIGEAVIIIPLTVRNSHPEIPWCMIEDFRSKLMASYFNVDLNAVWTFCKEDLTKFKQRIIEFIESNPQSA